MAAGSRRDNCIGNNHSTGEYTPNVLELVESKVELCGAGWWLPKLLALPKGRVGITMDYETDARFQCPQCENDVAANVPLDEASWSGENAATPEMTTVLVICPFCKGHFAARAWVTPSSCTLELVDHPLTPISASPPMVREVDDWDDYEPPDDPYHILVQSFAEAWSLLNGMGGQGGDLVNRLVFAHLIGAFEAFLADMLINHVAATPAALARLIERDKELREAKFSLTEIGANPEFIKDTVRSRLRRQIWHNLKQASALYNQAFEIDLLGILGEDGTTLDQAIMYRHDCVHRNGYDKDGQKLEVFTKEYIEKIDGILQNLVLEIVDKFATISATAFFVPTPSSAG